MKQLVTTIHQYLCLAVLLCCFCSVLTLQSCSSNAITLDQSGDLIIEDLTIGTGEKIPADSVIQVAIAYRGKLTDGTAFDSSTTGKPTYAALGAEQVIEGIEQGMRGMRIGGKRKITIPPRLGFGIQQFGSVPPNSTVIYEIELLGLQRLIIENLVLGTGTSVKSNNTLSVKYVGKLTDGTVFDRTIDNAQFTFRIGIGQVIKGWDIGLLNMQEGGKRRLTIPSELAYGSNGFPPTIPANATLIFEVELVTVRQ